MIYHDFIKCWNPQILNTSFFRRNRVIETLNWNVSYGYLLSSYKVPMSLILREGLWDLEVFSLAAGPRKPCNMEHRMMDAWRRKPTPNLKIMMWFKVKVVFRSSFPMWFLFAIFFCLIFSLQNKHVFLVIEAVEHRPDGSWLWATWWQTWWSRGPNLVVGWWSDVDTHRMLMSKMWFHMWSTKQINRCVVMKQPHAPFMRLVWGKLPKFVQSSSRLSVWTRQLFGLAAPGFHMDNFRNHKHVKLEAWRTPEPYDTRTEQGIFVIPVMWKNNNKVIARATVFKETKAKINNIISLVFTFWKRSSRIHFQHNEHSKPL